MTAPEGSRPASIEEERRKRLDFLDHPDDSPKREFESALGRFGSPMERDEIRRAQEFAESLQYDHPGQSAEVYLAHPLRVAALYLDLAPSPSAEGAATSLVHNALEVTDLDIERLSAAVGRSAAEAIELLTVDRARQWDPSYKEAYYRHIAEAGSPAAEVKVVDKLDNLFLLHLNPSAETRDRYLDEIEEWLIPLAFEAMPGVVAYLKALVADNRGYGIDWGVTGGERDG